MTRTALRLALGLVLVAIASCSRTTGTPADATSTDPATDPTATPADATGAIDAATDPTATPADATEAIDDAPAPNATVDRVVDGDTIVAEVQGRRERVRLLGIDTPESVAEDRPVQCYGVESSGYLAALLPHETPITLIRDVEARDQYDRLLAYVVRSSDGLFVNLDLVEKGFADSLTYPPNVYYAELLEGAAEAAAAADIGLWGACGGPDVPVG